MAKRNKVDITLEKLDAQIADLERAKALILATLSTPDGQVKTRKPRKAKRGLPTEGGDL